MNFHAFGYQLSYGLPVAAEPAEYKQQARPAVRLRRRDADPRRRVPRGGRLRPRLLRLLRGCGPGLAALADGPPRDAHAERDHLPRGHGTASGIPDHRRLVLYERNSLYALYKNYSDEYLARILPAALMLMGERALRLMELSGVDFSEYRPGESPAGARQSSSSVHPQAVSTMLAANEFMAQLPAFAAKRATGAGAAPPPRRGDLRPCSASRRESALINHATDAAYARAHYTADEHELGIADLFAGAAQARPADQPRRAAGGRHPDQRGGHARLGAGAGAGRPRPSGALRHARRRPGRARRPGARRDPRAGLDAGEPAGAGRLAGAGGDRDRAAGPT